MKGTARERLAAAELAALGIHNPRLMEPVQVAGRRLRKALEDARIELERFLARFAGTDLGEEMERLADPLQDAAAELNSNVSISPVDLLADIRKHRRRVARSA